ncbi:MAG: hypothetical protein K2X98_03905 [Alphaproteobacteria bacterium]|nr:hypothetical protein [Alphaproteobacteria bacterium]
MKPLKHSRTLFSTLGKTVKKYFLPVLMGIVVGLILHMFYGRMSHLESEYSILQNNLPLQIKELETKLVDIQKNMTQKMQELEVKASEHINAPPPEAKPLTPEQFQSYGLGQMQIASVKDALTESFVTKKELEEKDATALQSKALLYCEALKQAVLSGNPYGKILEAIKQAVLHKDTSSPPLITAFDILALSAQKGLPKLSELYRFPEDLSVTSESSTMDLWPSWLSWMKSWVKDNVHVNVHASKGLSPSEKQLILQLLDAGQIPLAIEKITHHMNNHADLKELWRPWLASADRRVKTLQSLDTIQHFLLESLLP